MTNDKRGRRPRGLLLLLRRLSLLSVCLLVLVTDSCNSTTTPTILAATTR